MYKLYGIKNCDTVKKALKALDKAAVEYTFIDFKQQAPSLKEIKRWKQAFGDWPVNQRGRTFREHKELFKQATDAQKVDLIQQYTSIIKRPVLELNDQVLCFGFDAEFYSKLTT